MRSRHDAVFSIQIYFIIFTFSGFSGLIYESIWSHYLKLFLGHAAYAQTLVLVIFMGGMALGAWGASRYGGRVRNLLMGYAIVEGIIGLLALVFHPVFTNATGFAYHTVIPSLDMAAAVNVFKWTMASLLILPQTILLGATFPLMSAGVIRKYPETPGKTLAVLYFVNSLGASAGVLASGFFLIEAVGLPGTILAAGVINIAISVFVWLLSRGESAAAIQGTRETWREARGQGRIAAGMLLCAALTGTASFMYEIGWIRMLNLVLGSSTHAFELMLSAFILGLAIGGYWIKNRIENLNGHLRILGVIQLVMGGLALATLLTYGQTFIVMSYIMNALAKTPEGYTVFNLLSHGLALSLMLPATICAGMTLPLITYYLVSRGYGEGAIGRVYAANTLGSIIGVILSVQLIMPLLGVKNVIVAGGAVDAAVGLALLRYSGMGADMKKWGGAAAGALAAILSVILFVRLDPVKMSSGVYRYGQIREYDKEILFHKDGKTASVDVYRQGESGKRILSISTNGKPDASVGLAGPSGDEPTMTLLAALPMAMSGEARTAANIGMGSGITTHTLLLFPSIELVDTIEIEPAMIEGAKLFGERSAKTFTDPRSHIRIEDAKTYFTSNRKKYDLIISEPSNPWVSGVASLFSKEFYSLVQNYLNDGGVFAQWLHLYEIDVPLIASVIKAMSESFGEYAIYFASDSDLIIVASREKAIGAPGDGVFSIPGLKEQLERFGVSTMDDLLLRKLGDKRSLGPLFASYPVPANSDFYPYLDLMSVRARYMEANANDLQRLRAAGAPLLETLEGRKPSEDDLSAGRSIFFTNGKKARRAAAIRDYFRRKKSGEDTSGDSLDTETAVLARGVRQDRESCGDIEMTKAWLENLHSLARSTLPFLSPAEMAPVWEEIFSSPCFSSLPEDAFDWARLYRAVSERDFAGAGNLSKKLLPGGAVPPSPDNDYLLMVAMLSGMAMGNTSESLEPWSRYMGRRDPAIELRLLAAVAIQRKLSGAGR